MKKVIWIGIAIIILIGSMLALRYYRYIFSPNVTAPEGSAVIHIPTGSDRNALIDTLTSRHLIKSESSLLWVADKMQFITPRPGKYRVRDGWSNKELVTFLRAQKQEAVELTFNNQRTLEDLCQLFASRLEPKKEAFLTHLYDSSTLNRLGLDSFNIMSLFIPNTYSVYWNSSPSSLTERMLMENRRFWNEKRSLQAEKLGLTRAEVYTLASIVQKETNLNSEKPVIAGVYLNRLKKGMLLQADPTVVYAVGDFDIKRVLNKHLVIDSPYNTYKYQGLPPGPIGMPDISTLDAVLNHSTHNYLYFCVKPGNSMEHVFASTLNQHLRNARRYQSWLNSQRIFN